MNFPKGFYWLLFYSLDFMPLKLTAAVTTHPIKCLSAKQSDYKSVSRWQWVGKWWCRSVRCSVGAFYAPSLWVSLPPLQFYVHCPASLNPKVFARLSHLILPTPERPSLTIPSKVASPVSLTLITLLTYFFIKICLFLLSLDLASL